MSNRLLDKIHSYTNVGGIDFDQSFSGSAPSQYGTYQMNDPTISVTNTNNGLTSTANDGPFPGQYSWRFKGSASPSTTGRLSYGIANTQMTAGSHFIYPMNYTMGIWVRINHDLNANPNYDRVITEYTTTGSSMGDEWYQGWFIGYVRDNNPSSPTYLKWGFNMYTGYIDEYYFTDGKGNPIEKNKWYFLSIRKVYTGSGNVTTEFYVDGVRKFNGSHSFSQDPTRNFNIGYGGTYDSDFSVAGYFLGPNTINATEIANIYNYGSPIQVPVKYYDGSSWQTSSNQQIWNGSKWIPMYANKWDGSAWIPL